MITEYHRPKNLEEALALLSRKNMLTLPLAGGTGLVGKCDQDAAVVDLQMLGLNKIDLIGETIAIGAAVTIQELVETEFLPTAFRQACRKEAGANIRHQATIGGTIQTHDDRSPLCAVLFALDAQLWVEPDQEYCPLGSWQTTKTENQGKLITKIKLPTDTKLGYEVVARTPEDKPIVIVAVGINKSGWTRIVVGGKKLQTEVVVEGRISGQLRNDTLNSHSHTQNNNPLQDYQQAVIPILANRLLSNLQRGAV